MLNVDSGAEKFSNAEPPCGPPVCSPTLSHWWVVSDAPKGFQPKLAPATGFCPVVITELDSDVMLTASGVTINWVGADAALA